MSESLPHAPLEALAREESCADWLNMPDLTDFQRLAVECLVKGLRTRIYNLNVNWKTVDWNYGPGVQFKLRAPQGLATYDFDQLTGLVLVAHERCVRICISALGFRYLSIVITPRQRDGGMAARHPTIEQALAAFRGDQS